MTVIIGILLTAAIPRLQQTALRMRVEQAAFELAQLLRLAHEQAITSDQEMVWVWDDQALRARVKPAQETADALMVVEGSAMPEGLSVLVSRNGEGVSCRCVRFFPQGTSEPATLTVSLKEQVVTEAVDETTSRVAISAGSAAR